MKTKVLLVEDEADLGNVVKQYLEISDFDVDWLQNGKLAYEKIRKDPRHYHIVLIDVSMPEMDGFQLAEKIVGLGHEIAFLFLTARNEKADRLHGLKIGADDYITKPFDVDELVLRIRNIIRRIPAATPVNRGSIVRGDVQFYKDTLKLYIGRQKEIVLTPRESELLDYLFRNENRVLRREEILTQLWGENDYFLGRSLDVFISRLRKHLSASEFVSIDNVYGVGFVFNVQE
ncbi:response regulator transcription factor [Flavitalea sp. BT771]|uniref:response regulator transcription factor n=1 Tax=Flavitalea sp. BT771 TaxID=3063329 RepID=UPI0026E42EE3|nr:response regulator transcription factor [Flavitalea sp. BT771]MDO6429259.1 response regulator transcription factor [Flavitalea sp. BT771]MDV6218613.1 response regulator transcription factor [Flavitalea sp. BT771]